MKLLYVLLGLSIQSCSASHIDSKAELMVADTTLVIGGVNVKVMRPQGKVKNTGTLLLLPGWNFSSKKWCDSSDVCKTALEKGITVVAPEMGKSIYATAYFPETREDYRKYPTLTWLDTALNIMKQKHHLFGTSAIERNYALGLSTGARGVALICAKKPGFFHAAALLSGDYNQAAVTDDALCTIVYGPYEKFAERWRTVDNPQSQIGNIITPMYIAHGGLDKVVHVTQSIEFYDSLYAQQKNAIMQSNAKWVVKKQKEKNPSETGGLTIKLDPLDFLELNVSGTGGHDWSYWRSELPAVWAFFDKR